MQAAEKKLSKFVKINKDTKPAAYPAGVGAEGEDDSSMSMSMDALPKKAMPVDQWIAQKEQALKSHFQSKADRIAKGYLNIEKDDRWFMCPW